MTSRSPSVSGRVGPPPLEWGAPSRSTGLLLWAHPGPGPHLPPLYPMGIFTHSHEVFCPESFFTPSSSGALCPPPAPPPPSSTSPASPKYCSEQTRVFNFKGEGRKPCFPAGRAQPPSDSFIWAVKPRRCSWPSSNELQTLKSA